MNAFLAIFNKELRAVTKERTIVIAILIQLFIASFSSALLIGLMSVYDPEAVGLSARVRVRMGIVGDTSNPLVDALQAHNVIVQPFTSADDAQIAYEAGHLDAALYIPHANEQDDSLTTELRLFLPPAETHATLILMVLQKPLKDYENLLRAQNDIHLRYQDLEGIPSMTYEFQYAVILPLLMFFPAFVSGNLVVDTICEELANRTLDTLWSAPLSLNTILGAKISAALALTGMQCVLWTMLLRFNDILIQNLGLVLLLALTSAGLIASAATLFALYFKDRERSQFIYSVFILLATSVSYFFDGSPIALMTRLATGDVFAGILDVLLYGALLAAVLAVLFSSSKKLLAVLS